MATSGRLSVNVVCRNFEDDRVLPRFARYLRDGLGWSLTRAPQPADVHYLMGYFETQVCRPWPSGPVASLFTHREEEPPNGAKALLYDEIARKVGLRVAMCHKYGEPLEKIGPTIQPPLPVERDRFVPAKKNRGLRQSPVVGLAGFTYRNKRKGDDLASRIIRSTKMACRWETTGHGWDGAKRTRMLKWDDMPSFYQQLDVLVCPSRVEGGPMPVLEALSCGVKVVVPRGVGIIDEIPDVGGIVRYKRGDVRDMEAALRLAIVTESSPEALRETVAAHSVEAWCKGHKEGFEQWLS